MYQLWNCFPWRSSWLSWAWPLPPQFLQSWCCILKSSLGAFRAWIRGPQRRRWEVSLENQVGLELTELMDYWGRQSAHSASNSTSSWRQCRIRSRRPLRRRERRWPPALKASHWVRPRYSPGLHTSYLARQVTSQASQASSCIPRVEDPRQMPYSVAAASVYMGWRNHGCCKIGR